jgi:hypothetical protein
MHKRRWIRFSRRAFISFIVALALIIVPCLFWTPEIFTWWQVPLVSLGFVLYIGILLFDTLFYDRYH